MALAIEVRKADSSHWERVETSDDHFPDVLHRTYEALKKHNAVEAALILTPCYRTITVFQKSDTKDTTYFRYQKAQTTYGRLKKIHGVVAAAG
jgi:glutamyl-tRNA reductase